MDNTIISDLKQRNDWLGILQQYNYQSFNRELKEDLEIANEILFAAKHWGDNVLSRVNSTALANQTMSIYLWCWKNARNYRDKNPDNTIILKTFAYQYYDLKFNGYALTKMCRKYKVKDSLQKELAIEKARCDNECMSAYKKILSITPNDFKANYYYAMFLEKTFQEQDYKLSPPEKRVYYDTTKEALKRVRTLFTELGSPASLKKWHVKASYALSRLLSDGILCSLFIYGTLRRYMEKDRILFQADNKYGPKWYPAEIEEAKALAIYVGKEVGLPNNFNQETLKIVAGIKNPIELPMYCYFRIAKILFAKALYYSSREKDVYYMRLKDPNKPKMIAHNAFELAVLYCERALDVRIERISQGFTDSQGIFPEAGFLVQLFLFMKDFTNSKLETLKVYYPKNNDVQYYYQLCTLYQDRINNEAKVLKNFENMLRNTKAESQKARIRRTIASIKEGKM